MEYFLSITLGGGLPSIYALLCQVTRRFDANQEDSCFSPLRCTHHFRTISISRAVIFMWKSYNFHWNDKFKYFFNSKWEIIEGKMMRAYSVRRSRCFWPPARSYKSLLCPGPQSFHLFTRLVCNKQDLVRDWVRLGKRLGMTWYDLVHLGTTWYDLVRLGKTW